MTRPMSRLLGAWLSLKVTKLECEKVKRAEEAWTFLHCLHTNLIIRIRIPLLVLHCVLQWNCSERAHTTVTYLNAGPGRPG